MVATGNVVKDFYVGNTHIRICDDYCRDKTPEQVKQILANIARISYHSMQLHTVRTMLAESLQRVVNEKTAASIGSYGK